jgi:chromosome segregation ATPase
MKQDRAELSQAKLFTFNASSFPLDPSVEGFLKSKGVISLDFGATAYINSEAMPLVLSELVEKSKTDAPSNADLVVQLKAEIGRHSAERQKVMEDNARIVSQVKSYSAEVAVLKEQAAGAYRLIEALKAENARLQAALKNLPAPTSQSDEKLKQSYEKLQKDFQTLRAQSAEALASLKVLEDENEELAQELELLKSQAKNAAAAKAG